MIDQWHHCYDQGWGKTIVKEAFRHPAKIAPVLASRIYEHAIDHGWVRAGDVVVDPFGGIAGTARAAGLRGLRWFGCELEQHFVDLGRANIEYWTHHFNLPIRHMPILCQGDSRNLAEVLQRANLIVSSPPYVSGGHHTDVFNAWNVNSRGQGIDKETAGYGKTGGQMGQMKEGAPPSLVVSSPPYGEISTGAGGLNTKPPKHEGQQGGRSANAASQDTDQRYGSSEGQLAKMTVGSPPYEKQNEGGGGIVATARGEGDYQVYTERPVGLCGYQGQGAADGQLANEKGDTFWTAAEQIVRQCHQILVPGGHAIWITKDFVRDRKVIPFGDQWQALCEANGFRLVCRHHAMLVENHGEQNDMFGETKKLTVSRKSFFRRLYESKPGAPRIDFEDVICLQKI